MALPAGRRGIRANLVKSDGTISDLIKNETAINSLTGSLAMVETSPATANHAVGDYLVLNGQLYEVTATIATGETLTVGTNISVRNVGEELTELNNGLITTRIFRETNISISGDSTAIVNFDVALTGYKAIGIVGYESSNADVIPLEVHVNNDTRVGAVARNIASSATTFNYTIYVLYLRKK